MPAAPAAAAVKSEVLLTFQGMPVSAPGARALASLQASNGSELELRSLSAHALVEGPLAFTELTLTFRNPSERPLEGTFELELPAGASVSRFALRVGQGLQEGEVLERSQAADVYRKYTAWRRDPGILTQDARNVFRARVFPIVPHEEREIIVSYSHELVRALEPYRLPLAGLAHLAALDVRVVVQGAEPNGAATLTAYTLRAADLTPERDFVLPLNGRVRPADAVRGGSFAVARITPVTHTDAQPLRELSVLIDTSASRALDFEADLERLQQLTQALGAAENPRLDVLAFDQQLTPMFSGDARQFDASALARLRQRGALGASDPTRALHALAASGARQRLLVLSDCKSTIEQAPTEELGRALAELRRAGLARADVVPLGLGFDRGCAHVIAGGGRTPGALLGPDAGVPAGQDVLAGLRRAMPGAARFSVAGSRWVYPESVSGLAPGEPVLVFAELPQDQPFSVEVDTGVAHAPSALWTDDALVSRAAVRARITELSERHVNARPPEQPKLRSEIVGLSERYRVLSPFTALLVLESAAEYERWGIARSAQSDILHMGQWSLERERPQPPPTGGQSGSAFPLDASEARAPFDQDRDGDGIPDPLDACPAEPGPSNPNDGRNGCPSRIVVEGEQILLLRSIQFEAGSTRIAPESLPILDEVATLMKARPALRVELQGHSDALGAPLQNQKASERRALAIADYLVRHGIARSRLVTRGFGATRPLADNATAEGRARNRRVDFKLIPAGQTRADDPPPLATPRPKPPAVGPARSGVALDVARAIAAGNGEAAVTRAFAEYRARPNALSALLIGEGYQALGKPAEAARAYGSLLDFAEDDLALLRVGAYWLAHLGARGGAGSEPANALALAALRRSVAERANDTGSLHDLALELLRQGQLGESYELLDSAVHDRHLTRLSADLELVARVLVQADPARSGALDSALGHSATPSLSVIVSVAEGGRPRIFLAPYEHGTAGAYQSELADSELDTLGLGVDRLRLHGGALSRRYRIGLASEQTAPLFGRLQLVHDDGSGHVTLEERPFLLQTGDTLAELGEVVP